MTIRLIVVDDQEIVRKALASLLAGEDIEIVAEGATGKEAVSKTKAHKPDVLLMGVRMPEMDGLGALERIRESGLGTKVILMSCYDNLGYVARAAALGAADFLSKDLPSEAFVDAIQRAARGQESPADSPLHRIKATLQMRRDPKADDVPLTRREYQVLRHLAHGLSNRDIGFSLNISVETVGEHVQNILRKLDMPDRTAAAVWAVERGLV